jgi:hypothetical protein
MGCTKLPILKRIQSYFMSDQRWEVVWGGNGRPIQTISLRLHNINLRAGRIGNWLLAKHYVVSIETRTEQ